MWTKLLLLIVGLNLTSGGGVIPRTELKTSFQDTHTPFMDYEDDSSILPMVDPYDGISYRLPNTTQPISYEIGISTDIHIGEFRFDGHVVIYFRCIETTSEFVLQYRELTMDNIALYDSNENIIVSEWHQNDTLEFLTILPNQDLIEDQEYFVSIHYHGIMTDNGLGIYRASYVDDDGNTKWLASTQFQATEARRAFPR